MKRVAVYLPLLLAATIVQAQHRDDLPELNNFAWGFPVEITEMASFYRLPLPAAVYAAASDPDLRDLAVYNAAGQPVPRVVEAGQDTVTGEESISALPFAAIYRDRLPAIGEMRLIFERMQGRARIDLRSDAADEKIRPPLTGYVVDARSLGEPIDALEIDWPDNSAGFMGRLQVSGSDDLESWQTLGSGVLASLREGDADIRRHRVDLNREQPCDFLRLTLQDLPQGWRASSVSAVQWQQSDSTRRETVILDAERFDDSNNAWEYTSDAALPVDRVGLVLAEANAVVSAEILVRADDEQTWRSLHRGTFYRLQRNDAAVSSEAASVAMLRNLHWRVQVRGGNLAGAPQLELQWRPDNLLFVAQGNGPYTLAVGRKTAAAENFPENRLLGEVSLGSIATDNGPVAEAAVGAQFPLGGIERERPAKPLPWQTILLWAALVLAVLFVAAMAYRLLRGMQGN